MTPNLTFIILAQPNVAILVIKLMNRTHNDDEKMIKFQENTRVQVI